MTDGRTKRAEANRELRRRQILDRALLVFAERGYHGASITDVVKAAGVARGTFYLYFDSKEAVFLDLLDDLLRTLRSSVEGVDLRPDARPLEEQLRQIVCKILRTTEHRRSLTRIIFREAVGLDEAVEAKLREFQDELHQWLVAALQVGEALQMVRPTARDVVATSIIGTVREVIDRYVVRTDQPFDAEEVSSGVVSFCVYGLLPR